MKRLSFALALLVVLQLGYLVLSPFHSTPRAAPRLHGLEIIAPEPPHGELSLPVHVGSSATSVHHHQHAEKKRAAAEPATEPAAEHVQIQAEPKPAVQSRENDSPLTTSHTQQHATCTESTAEAIIRARRRAPIPTEWREKRAAAFERYIKLHHAFIKAGGSATHADVPGRGTLPRKFIIVKPCCQLCNRVRVLIAALALGILTDRAVLIEFDGSGHQGDYYGRFDDLFDSPLRVQAKLPRQVEARLRLATVSTESAGGFGGNPGGGSEGGEGSTAASVGPTVGRNLPWLTMMTDFMCVDPLAWKEPALTIQGSPGFLHAIYLSSSLRPSFEQAFGGGLEGLFAAIFHSLLRPRAQIVSQARAFVDGLVGGRAAGELPTRVVGLHIRNGRDFRTKKLLDDEWTRLAGCARALVPTASGGGDGGGGGADGSANGDGTAGDANGDGGAESGGARRGAVRFAVATESGESRTAAASALGDAVAFYMEPLPKGKDGGTTSREGAKRALLELLIVSMSNATLLTPMSSFSETVAALNGRPGIYFHFDITRKFHFESATEVLPGCFVPWTAEMPGSMNLHSVLHKLPNRCAERVRRLDAGGPWTSPCGLRFLDGSSKLPEKLSRKATAF